MWSNEPTDSVISKRSLLVEYLLIILGSSHSEVLGFHQLGGDDECCRIVDSRS